MNSVASRKWRAPRGRNRTVQYGTAAPVGTAYNPPSNWKVLQMEHQNHGEWEQSIEKLKETWSRFTEGMFLAIREEELRIRREEVEKHDGTRSRHCAAPAPEHSRGEWGE